MAEMVKHADKVATFRQLFANKDLRRQLEAAAPTHLRAERIIRLALTAMNAQPRLFDCTWQSVVGCVMTSTQLGLEFAGGQAYLVPFKNNQAGTLECVFIPGYKGLISLAVRSDQVVAVESRVVWDCDEFQYQDEPPMMQHKRSPDRPEDANMVGAYAVAVMTSGASGILYRQYEYMTAQQIAAIRKRSRAKNDGPWVTDTEEMWRKCPVRKGAKNWAMSSELSRAIELDQQADCGIPQSLDTVDENLLDAPDDETSAPHVSPATGASSTEAGAVSA
jgi:recombination protein RecT